jgi:hypothetical protein
LNPHTRAILSFNPFLLITRLHGLVLIRQQDNAAQPTPKRLLIVLRYRAYQVSTGILTSFPFLTIQQLSCELGSTNSSLTNSAKKPLPFRPCGFSPHYDEYLQQDYQTQSGPHKLTFMLLSTQVASLPEQKNYLFPKVSVTYLAPSIFGACNLER